MLRGEISVGMNGARSAHLESAHVLVRPPRAAVEFYGAGYESVRDTWRWPQELHGSALAPPPASRVLTRFEFYVSCSRNVSTAGDPPRAAFGPLYGQRLVLSPDVLYAVTEPLIVPRTPVDFSEKVSRYIIMFSVLL